MRESKLQRYLIVELMRLGALAEKKVTVGRRGHPDLEVSWPGDSPNGYKAPYGITAHQGLVSFKYQYFPMVEFIETKVKGGKLEPWQERDHARRRAMGFQVHTIWSMVQAEEYLKSRGMKVLH